LSGFPEAALFDAQDIVAWNGNGNIFMSTRITMSLNIFVSTCLTA
jgi:hypothetical protein